jgi:hypothetical protein
MYCNVSKTLQKLVLLVYCSDISCAIYRSFRDRLSGLTTKSEASILRPHVTEVRSEFYNYKKNVPVGPSNKSHDALCSI